MQTPLSDPLTEKNLLCAIWPEEDLDPALHVFKAIKQKTYQASPYAELKNQDAAQLNSFCREVPALFDSTSSAPPSDQGTPNASLPPPVVPHSDPVHLLPKAVTQNSEPLRF